ncbi:sperm-tail PG-rich repeat-containing protein 2 [Osmerus eperlanus]|uniref:sperm-tail PG-rich repeat-containing protein 2 n=1 Tax=Osmerus eperlanus TaxID=29151 RepID=UPI002E13A513
MYGRAPRVIYLPLGSTSPGVGPGSYDAHEQKHKKSDCYAPFLSLSNRESIFTKSDNEISLPGPGQYDSPLPKGNILGGQSLQNRSRRFEEVVSVVPGPGAYDVLPRRGNPARAESVPPGGRSQRESVSKRLKFVVQPDIPSIPSPGQALGYEETSRGLLCRHTAPPQDHTLGPAFYTPATDHSTSQRYKGVHFGRMTGKRMEMRVLQGPGPGDYEPEKETTVEYEHLNMRREQHRRAELVIPRYHDILPLQEEKRGVPGPGQYHIKSQFEKTSSPYTTSSPPFLSQAQRFCPVKERAPPLGVYDDPRCALELLKKTTGMKRSPFGLTAVRFSPGNHRDDSPGPGSYNVFAYGLARDSLRRACLDSSRKGAFGSVAQRSPPFHIRHEDQPGPGQYKVEEKTEEFYKKKHTAVFKSLTERLTMPLLAKPGPLKKDLCNVFLKGTPA